MSANDLAGGGISQWLGSKQVSRRDFLRGALVLGASASVGSTLAACGSSGGTSASPLAGGSPKMGGHLRLGITAGSAQDTIDPQRSFNLADNTRVSQVFEGLLIRDHNFKIVPSLAEEVTANAAGDVWTARLRSDVIWHNGKPLSADDVIYTLALIFDPEYPNEAKMFFEDIDRAATRKIDDRTVEFHLKRPNGIFDDFLSETKMMIKPAGWKQGGDLEYVGTGPFKVDSFVPGDRSVTIANPDYWGVGPYVEKVTTVNFKDATAQVNALLGGVVDLIGVLPAAQVPAVKNAGYNVLEYETGAISYIFWHTGITPTSDKLVRQAMATVMDREEMVELALGGLGRPGNDMWGVFDDAYPKDFPQRTADPEKAKWLLSQAGHSSLTIPGYTSEVGTGLVALMQVFAEQAKTAGITVNLQKLDPTVYYGDEWLTWMNGPGQYSARSYLPQAHFFELWNEAHFENEQRSKLLAEAQGTVDATKRNEMIRECYTIDYDECAYTIPMLVNNADAAVTNLQGMVPDPGGPPFNNGAVNELWFT